jgi:hypothetical protein
VRLAPDDIAACLNHAQALYRGGRTDAAIAALDAAAARAPDCVEVPLMLATLHELANAPEAAQRCAEAVLARQPGNPSATVILAKLAQRRDDAAGALARLDTLDPDRLNEAQQVTWLAERGRALDRLGRYGEAFAAFGTSGAVLARLQDGLPAQDMRARDARLTAIETGLAADDWRRLALADTPHAEAPRPVFVLGFMRSGTTLIERILGAHPQIAPAGELSFIADIADELAAMLPGGFPAGLRTLGDTAAHDLLAVQRRRYLDRVRALPGDAATAPFVVDKAPFNAEHIGLIRLLFPHAPVFHAVRHPLDVVLSSHFTSFADPQPWSYRLADTASLYARLHDHLAAMAALLPQGAVPVRYETLVDTPEPEIRALLGHIGVGWYPACLAFHERARDVQTASYAQVARPLYRSSVERYRHYLPFIDPSVIATLRPALDALGYDVAP